MEISTSYKKTCDLYFLAYGIPTNLFCIEKRFVHNISIYFKEKEVEGAYRLQFFFQYKEGLFCIDIDR